MNMQKNYRKSQIIYKFLGMISKQEPDLLKINFIGLHNILPTTKR